MNILKIIQYIFVGLIAAIALLLVISTFPITGNFQVLTVLSGSMEPALTTGSIVLRKPGEIDKIGDINAARTILKEHLLWLLDCDPASLGADQRQIREMVVQITKEGKNQDKIK